MSGFEDNVREARRSGSLLVGIGEARVLCTDDSGVPRTEDSGEVATRRIVGGRCRCKMVKDEENTC